MGGQQSNTEPDDAPKSGSPALGIFTLMLAVYLLPFLALYLDELVFRTNFLQQFIPDSARPWLATIYYPLIKLVRWLHRI